MWITEFRQAHGLTLEELGRAIRYVGRHKDPPLRVSDILLENLEMRRGYRTVPALANLIAEVCGATAMQRDALVLPCCRGTWTPTGESLIAMALQSARRSREQSEKQSPGAPDRESAKKARVVDPMRGQIRAVVQIDRQGNVLARFPNMVAAGAAMAMDPETVRKRCLGQMKRDEFQSSGTTVRFADEWSAMTVRERTEAVRKAASSPANDVTYGRPVVVIDKNGNSWRFPAATSAARMTGDSLPAICHRLKGGWKRSIFNSRGFAYCYAEEWDAMSEEEKREYLTIQRGNHHDQSR